jgi:hypothetical protein
MGWDWAGQGAAGGRRSTAGGAQRCGCRVGRAPQPRRARGRGGFGRPMRRRRLAHSGDAVPAGRQVFRALQLSCAPGSPPRARQCPGAGRRMAKGPRLAKAQAAGRGRWESHWGRGARGGLASPPLSRGREVGPSRLSGRRRRRGGGEGVAAGRGAPSTRAAIRGARGRCSCGKRLAAGACGRRALRRVTAAAGCCRDRAPAAAAPEPRLVRGACRVALLTSKSYNCGREGAWPRPLANQKQRARAPSRQDRPLGAAAAALYSLSSHVSPKTALGGGCASMGRALGLALGLALLAGACVHAEHLVVSGRGANGDMGARKAGRGVAGRPRACRATRAAAARRRQAAAPAAQHRATAHCPRTARPPPRQRQRDTPENSYRAQYGALGGGKVARKGPPQQPVRRQSAAHQHPLTAPTPFPLSPAPQATCCAPQTRSSGPRAPRRWRRRSRRGRRAPRPRARRSRSAPRASEGAGLGGGAGRQRQPERSQTPLRPQQHQPPPRALAKPAQPVPQQRDLPVPRPDRGAAAGRCAAVRERAVGGPHERGAWQRAVGRQGAPPHARRRRHGPQPAVQERDRQRHERAGGGLGRGEGRRWGEGGGSAGAAAYPRKSGPRSRRPLPPLLRPCQPFTLPAYAGLTLGGILATSSHGSGDMQPSTLIDTVVEVVWVDAKVRRQGMGGGGRGRPAASAAAGAEWLPRPRCPMLRRATSTPRRETTPRPGTRSAAG